MPDTTWPVDRHPPGSSRGHKPSPVSMPHAVFRHVISGSLALAFVVHTCRARRRDFSATLTTPALNRRSSRWFEASPCRAAPEGQTSISCTAPHSVTGSSTSSLLQRSWSHVYATPSWKTRSAATAPSWAWLSSARRSRSTSMASDSFHGFLRLIAADDPQLGPVLFGLQDGRLPLPRQILEGVSIEQRLLELPSLKVAHFAQRRVGHDRPHAAAQVSACHWGSLDRAKYGRDRGRRRTSKVSSRQE